VKQIVSWVSSSSSVMLAIAGAMALALRRIGIYGVISYTVSKRRREIGIRLALGAHGADVLHMVLRQSAKDGVSGRGNWDSGCFGIDGLDEQPTL
jgi:ABC-type antimicrobial peptide transport system permease subunit